MRVLACGSRTWTDMQMVEDVLQGVWQDYEVGYDVVHRDTFVLIEGGAKGADEMASWWADSSPLHWYGGKFEHLQFKADWDKHGRAAGPIRNRQMLDEGKPDLVVAFSDYPITAGTQNMIDLAKLEGVPVWVCSHG